MASSALPFFLSPAESWTLNAHHFCPAGSTTAVLEIGLQKTAEKRTEKLDWQDKSDERRVNKKKEEEDKCKPCPVYQKEHGIAVSTVQVHRQSFTWPLFGFGMISLMHYLTAK